MSTDYRATARAALASYRGSDARDAAGRVVAAWSPQESEQAAQQQAYDLVVLLWRTERRTATAPSAAGVGQSWKVKAIREWAQRARATRVHAGPLTYMPLNECGEVELMFAAAERRDLAEQNAARAEQYEVLAKALADHGAATVAALPDTALRTAIGGDIA